MLNIFAVEDKMHFLLACSLFNEARQSFIEEKKRIVLSTAPLNDFNIYCTVHMANEPR